MGGNVGRLSKLGMQLEQAFAEGIISRAILEKILDSLQMIAEFAIEREQQQQLGQWSREYGCRWGENPQLLAFEEEDILYQEYVRSLPEGL